ncbi:hypothetical protein [Hymenobacter jejuensis]|uniref:Uncharacterized protein n=1 Tax=Hymenobacter jejuensis TaxID=2502781 RepID=A0A5B8A0Q6_9BACT|nr:hypothetical protein [Hymenobacter jejuensis]QDA60838.1 hypothetical protein FHG12_12310 [Hymenobacter jejuensis]
MLSLVALAPVHAQKSTSTPRYLMLVRDLDLDAGGLATKPTLTVIEDGTFTTVELPTLRGSTYSKKVVNASMSGRIDSTTNLLRRNRYVSNLLYQAEVKKLNELGTQGWVLVNTLQEGTTVRYLLQKNEEALGRAGTSSR